MTEAPSTEIPKHPARGGRWRWGCTLLALLLALPIVFVLKPYSLETVALTVPQSQARCTISVSHVSGWRHGVLTESVAYPLKVIIFVNGCEGLPDGRPFNATLYEWGSGKFLAQGMACANRREKDYPCRVEVPPIVTRQSNHLFILRIARTENRILFTGVKVRTVHEWRSAFIDMLMSV